MVTYSVVPVKGSLLPVEKALQGVMHKDCDLKMPQRGCKAPGVEAYSPFAELTATIRKHS